MITGRDDIEAFRTSGKFKERIEVTWKYAGKHNQMPTEEEGELMEQVQQALQKAVEKDKLAILTGIYTGAGERTWVFYARTARVFGERLNEASNGFGLLPITLYVENDVEWNEYQELLEIKPFDE